MEDCSKAALSALWDAGNSGTVSTGTSVKGYGVYNLLVENVSDDLGYAASATSKSSIIAKTRGLIKVAATTQGSSCESYSDSNQGCVGSFDGLYGGTLVGTDSARHPAPSG